MLTIAGILLASLLQAGAGASDQTPRILNLQLSAHAVRPGDVWVGRITTSTNVASLEMRCPWFSVSLPRERFGLFVFRYSILDVPVIFRRIYTVRFIARNTAGMAVERSERVDFR